MKQRDKAKQSSTDVAVEGEALDGKQLSEVEEGEIIGMHESKAESCRDAGDVEGEEEEGVEEGEGEEGEGEEGEEGEGEAEGDSGASEEKMEGADDNN